MKQYTHFYVYSEKLNRIISSRHYRVNLFKLHVWIKILPSTSELCVVISWLCQVLFWLAGLFFTNILRMYNFWIPFMYLCVGNVIEKLLVRSYLFQVTVHYNYNNLLAVTIHSLHKFSQCITCFEEKMCYNNVTTTSNLVKTITINHTKYHPRNLWVISQKNICEKLTYKFQYKNHEAGKKCA